VVAAHNAEAVIESCLTALHRQTAFPSMDVIVADSSTDATPDIVRERFPWVRLIHCDDPLTVPALRGQGVAAAGGAVIAFLDPFSMPDDDWAAKILEAHSVHPHKVIGGSVDLHRAGDASYGDWSIYLNEYGRFMSPTVRGKTGILPGTNVSYKRDALYDGATPRYPVFWKTNVNWALERGGSAQWLEPDIRVQTRKPVAFADFLWTRFHHGRCFAGMRVAGEGAALRILRAASTAIVPVLLLWRLAVAIWPKRRFRARLVATMPAQLALFAVWAFGETCGYLGGTGRSCGQIFY